MLFLYSTSHFELGLLWSFPGTFLPPDPLTCPPPQILGASYISQWKLSLIVIAIQYLWIHRRCTAT